MNKQQDSNKLTITSEEYQEFLEFKLKKIEKEVRDKRNNCSDDEHACSDSWDGDSSVSGWSAAQDHRGRSPGPKSSITINKKRVVKSRLVEKDSAVVESTGVDACKFCIVPEFALIRGVTPFKPITGSDDVIKRLAEQCSTISIKHNPVGREQFKPIIHHRERRQVAAPDFDDKDAFRRRDVSSERYGGKSNERDKSWDRSSCSSRSSVRRGSKTDEQPKNSVATTSGFGAIGTLKNKPSNVTDATDNTGAAKSRRDISETGHVKSKHNPEQTDYEHLSTEELRRYVHTLNSLLYQRKREADRGDESSDEYSIIDGEQTKRQIREGSTSRTSN